MCLDDFSDGIVAWLTTRAAVYPMRNYVYRLVTTSFRPIIPLSLPGRQVTISSPTTFGSVQFPVPPTMPHHAASFWEHVCTV